MLSADPAYGEGRAVSPPTLDVTRLSRGVQAEYAREQQGNAEDGRAASQESTVMLGISLIATSVGIAVPATDLDRALEADTLVRATVAVRVVGPDGVVRYDHHGDALLVAASVTKLLPAVAVLDTLGPEATTTTRLVASGVVEAGVLVGDLVLVGSGDPSLLLEDPHQELARWAASVRSAGIERVDGGVVVDGRVFGRPPLGAGWAWDDALWRFAAPITGVVIHHNTTHLTVTGGEAGAPPEVTVAPLSACVPVEVLARTGDGELWIDRPFGDVVTTIGGAIAPGASRGFVVTLPDPEQCVADALRTALIDAGVEVGDARVAGPGEPPASGVDVLTVTSPPVADLLRDVLVDSDNLYAESLTRWLDPAPDGKTFAGAEPGLRAALARAGVPDGAVVLADGSGLSRYGRTSPAALTGLLAYADDQPWRDVFRDRLAVAGRSGTLRSRLTGAPTEGLVRGKTGSMTGVSNLAVYVPTPAGEYVVAVLIDGATAPRDELRAWQDELVRQVASARRWRRAR